MSRDGRSWEATSLANSVSNCAGQPGGGKVPDSGASAIATDGRQVVIVGYLYPRDAAGCADLDSAIRPIAWQSEDGRTWRRSEPFTAGGPNGRATGVWAVPGGWRAVIESMIAPLRVLWQSADGLHWETVGELHDIMSPGVHVGTSADGTIVSSREIGELGSSRLRLYRSLDGLGLTWQPIDNAGGCEIGATDIHPPRSPGLDAWVVLSDLKICTSADLKAWSTEELGIAVWHIAQTRFGAIALGDTCYGAGVDCPDPGVRAYLTVDGVTWSQLDHPKAYYGRMVADGPAGVLLLGSGPDDLQWPTVWLLEP